jgi:hypothetical protein
VGFLSIVTVPSRSHLTVQTVGVEIAVEPARKHEFSGRITGMPKEQSQCRNVKCIQLTGTELQLT